MKYTQTMESNGVTYTATFDSSKAQEATVLGTIGRVASSVQSLGINNLWVTLLNKVMSIGTFNTVAELKAALPNKVNGKVKNSASMEDVKNWISKGKGKLKNGIDWWFTYQAADKIKNIPNTNFRLIEVEGKPVGIMKMRFGKNTMDAMGLLNQQLVLVNGFTGSGDNIKPVKIGKAYIEGKDTPLSTRESLMLVERGNASFLIETE